MLYEFIKEVCGILEISPPIISFDTSKFTSKTMLGQCSPNGSTIYLKKYDKANLNQLFTIAHELRHVWQRKTDANLFFTDYKPREDCSSVEEYNLQLAELDANAFGRVILVSFFHVEPLFKGLSEYVKIKIKEQADYIYKELS